MGIRLPKPVGFVAAISKNQPDEALKLLVEGERVFRQTLGDENIYVGFNLEQQAIALSQKNDFNAAEKRRENR